MMRTTRPNALVLVSALLGCIGSARAQESAIPLNEVRLGAYFVHYATKADDLSGPFTPADINLRVGNTTTPYLAYLRSLDANWIVEFAGGVPPTTKTYGKGPATVGSVPFDGQLVAKAKWFSPSVLLDYKLLDTTSALRPYVGLGVNYTRFYDLISTPAGDAANGGPTRITLSRSIGPAVTLGASYRITREINVLASYNLARVNSNYQSDTAGVVRTTTIHFNPRAWVAAIGYSF